MPLYKKSDSNLDVRYKCLVLGFLSDPVFELLKSPVF